MEAATVAVAAVAAGPPGSAAAAGIGSAVSAGGPWGALGVETAAVGKKHRTAGGRARGRREGGVSRNAAGGGRSGAAVDSGGDCTHGDGGGGADGGGSGCGLHDRCAAPDRPTHFLALRLSHTHSVTEAIDRVQAGLVAHHPSLRDFLEPSVKAHLTLLVMALHQGPMLQQPQLRGQQGQQPQLETGAEDAPMLAPLAADGKHDAAPGAAGQQQEQQQQQGQLQRQSTPLRQRAAPAAQDSELLPWRLVASLQRMAELPAALRAAGADHALSLRLRGLGAFGSKVLFLEVDHRNYDDDGGGGGTHAHNIATDGAMRSYEEARPATAEPSAPEAMRNGPTFGASASAAAAVVAACADGAAAGGDGARMAVMALQAAVADHFESLKFEEGARPFAPHVTIAKYSYKPPAARGRGNGGGRGTNRAPLQGTPGASADPGGQEQQQQQEPGGEAGSRKKSSVDDGRGNAACVSVTDEYGNRIIDVPVIASPATAEGQQQGRQGGRQAEGGPLKSIPREAYEAFQDIDAGCVFVDRVQLCAMSGRSPGEYYRVLAEVRLGAEAGAVAAGTAVEGDSMRAADTHAAAAAAADGTSSSSCSSRSGGGGCGGPGNGIGGVGGDGSSEGLASLVPGCRMDPAVWLSEEAVGLVRAAAAALQLEEQGQGGQELQEGTRGAQVQAQVQEKRGCVVM